MIIGYARVSTSDQNLDAQLDQTETWWEGIDVQTLEFVRRRLRDVVHLIEKTSRTILYSNFEDEFGTGQNIDLPGTSGVDVKSFKRKARAFLRAYEDNVALVKVRTAKPLTSTDIEALQTMLTDAGVGSDDDLEAASEAADGFVGFLRSLVGLDRKAVEASFAEFLDPSASPNQIEFIGMVIDHLTENGAMDPGQLYESPFSDIAPSGPDDLFSGDKVVSLVRVIGEISATPEDTDTLAS